MPLILIAAKLDALSIEYHIGKIVSYWNWRTEALKHPDFDDRDWFMLEAQRLYDSGQLDN